MTIAPPRPVDAGDRVPVTEPDTTALRRQAHGLRLAAGMFLVPVAILLALVAAEYRMWAPLTHDGRRAPAEVVGASRWKWSDRIRVAFATPDGRLVEASIPVGDLSRYAKGMTVEVAYDPANPRRVRTVDGWNAPYVVPLGVAGVFGLLVLGFAWRGWRWPRRLAGLASQDAPGRPMVLASVTVAGRAPVPWAVLWDRDAPPDARPVLAFRLADADDAPDGAIDVELVAERRRKAAGFVRTPTGVIWPAGKVRPLPKNVRRAVERAERALTEADVETPRAAMATAAPAGIELPDVRGDLPALPPGFFDQVPERDPVSAKALLAIIPMVLATTTPFLLSEVVEAHRQVCPRPPVSAPGASGILPADALAAALPTSLPGYTAGSERQRPMATIPDTGTTTAIVAAGYVSGYERTFVAGARTVRMNVFQFSSELGPARYEAQRMATTCQYGPKRLALPAASGASGVIVPGADRPLHRMSFVRGNRDYVVNMEGFDVTGEAEVLARVLDTAR